MFIIVLFGKQYVTYKRDSFYKQLDGVTTVRQGAGEAADSTLGAKLQGRHQMMEKYLK